MRGLENNNSGLPVGDIGNGTHHQQWYSPQPHKDVSQAWVHKARCEQAEANGEVCVQG
jgi:hypothetical protein